MPRLASYLIIYITDGGIAQKNVRRDDPPTTDVKFIEGETGRIGVRNAP